MDSLDVSRLGSIFTKQVRIQFAEVPIMEGLDATKTYFKSLWANLASMEHEIDAAGMYQALATKSTLVYSLLTNGRMALCRHDREPHISAVPHNMAASRR